MPEQNPIALISLIVSALALLVSFGSYWASHWKQGQVLMTKPTIFFFGWDGITTRTPKIFMRCLLFSTAQTGRILENLYLNVTGPNQNYCFDFWGHTVGDSNFLTKGSGLFIGQVGVSANHHFNPEKSIASNVIFSAGKYEIEVMCRQFGDTTDRKLGRFELELESHMSNLLENGSQVLWSLNPNSQSYRSEVSPRKDGLES
jgi:hypothetical protein